MQMVMQGQWHTDSTLFQCPFSQKIVDMFSRQGITCLPELLDIPRSKLKSMMTGLLDRQDDIRFWKMMDELPVVDVETKIGKRSRVEVGHSTQLT